MSRSRAWCFTINNPKKFDVFQFWDMECRYKIFGFEEGESNTLHMQGYVYFEDAKTMSTLKKLLTRAHIEIAKGTPTQASEYCKKDLDYVEYGTLPVKGRATFEKIQAAMEDPTCDMALYNQYRRCYKEMTIQQYNNAVKDRKVYAIHADDIYKHAAKYPRKDVFMDQDMKTYEYEPVYFDLHTNGNQFPVLEWIAGYAKRIQRGYEIIHVDPTVYYMVYDDSPRSKQYIESHIHIVDRVWSQNEDLE